MDLCKLVPQKIRTNIEKFQAARIARKELNQSSQELAKTLEENNLTMGSVDILKIGDRVISMTGGELDDVPVSVSEKERIAILASLGFSPDGNPLPKD